MIGVFEWNVTSYATEWFVPVNDLVEIYKWDQNLKTRDQNLKTRDQNL